MNLDLRDHNNSSPVHDTLIINRIFSPSLTSLHRLYIPAPNSHHIHTIIQPFWSCHQHKHPAFVNFPSVNFPSVNFPSVNFSFVNFPFVNLLSLNLPSENFPSVISSSIIPSPLLDLANTKHHANTVGNVSWNTGELSDVIHLTHTNKNPNARWLQSNARSKRRR